VSEYSLRMSVSTRQTAEERREAVLDAATHEFAVKGYHGASTEDIARAAGISQPYLFRLFGSKKELYLAAFSRCENKLYDSFAEAVKGKTGEAALHAMGEAYMEFAQVGDRLMLMLKTWSSDDPDVRRISRTGWRNIVDLAEQASKESPEVVSRFFANGMLITILMSMGLVEDPEPWATRLMEACMEAIQE
jgi:AcrR family transcriptional regulator